MRIYVTNIPIRGFTEGTVEIPDDTPPEGIQDAVTKILSYGPHVMGPGWGFNVKELVPEEVEVDKALIACNWQFDIQRPFDG